jgi:hypothetical protein
MDGTQDGAMGQPGFQPISGAYSLLIRDGDYVYATMNLKSLTPGHVITTWYGVFNNPAACMTKSVDMKLQCTIPDLQVAAVGGSVTNSRAGAVVRSDGSSIIGGILKKGDTTAAQTGMGLTDVAKADIHVLARTHGMVSTSSVVEQMNSFNGGCAGACPNLVVAGHHAEAAE